MANTQSGHKVHYGLIFFFLCICTALSWIADEAKQNGWLTNWAVIAVIVLAIAVAKAMFVLTYFMHLKFEGKWKFILLAPTTVLAIGLPLALLPDIGLHYYTNTAPQIQDSAPETTEAVVEPESPEQH